MKKIIMTKGLPASGKSTWAKQYQMENPNTVRVNKDELRSMLHNGVHSKGRESFVLEVRDFIVETALADGHDVIVDDTNFHSKHKNALWRIAAKYNAILKVQDFTDVPLEVCIERDKNRPNSVGENVIRGMFNLYINNKILEDVDPAKVWITTDTHFNHQMFIDEGIRPADFNERIIEEWNKHISPDDHVIHLGDVIFGPKDKLKEIMEKLNGHKILVRGNHDYKPDEWYLQMGFEAVCNQMYYKDILFTHIPVAVPNDVRLNVHGHLHNSTHRLEEVKDILGPKNKLIALELTDYKPVCLKEFCE